MKRKPKSKPKDKLISIRMTTEDAERFKQIAEEQHMSFGEAVLTRARSASDVKPLAVARVQDALSAAKEIALTYAPEQIEKLNELEDQIWSLLS